MRIYGFITERGDKYEVNHCEKTLELRLIAFGIKAERIDCGRISELELNAIKQLYNNGKGGD
jgi:hypothetical protein|tara:strand:- start:2918 stop:3103 length:186 start_codon:yes stop_codon:yes gene_type:complete